jgi:hypothetical protein
MNAYDVIVTQQHKTAPQINYVVRRWATAEVRRESAIAVHVGLMGQKTPTFYAARFAPLHSKGEILDGIHSCKGFSTED